MTSGDPTTSDHEVAVQAALAGAAVVRDMYGGALTRFDKGAGDFATAADIAAEQAILDVLRSARPADAVIGEESGHSGAAAAERTWLVDPLCGTLNYATGGMLVAVNVALRVGTSVTAAAVADPFTHEVFSTTGDGTGTGTGTGAHVQPGDPARLHPSAVPPLVDVNLDPSHDGVPADRATRLIADPEFRRLFRPRVLSTTLALTWVAAGRRAAYVTGGDMRDNVHFAAGIALCQAAGCIVTDLDGRPWDAGTSGLIAAADSATHQTLLTLLATHPARV